VAHEPWHDNGCVWRTSGPKRIEGTKSGYVNCRMLLSSLPYSNDGTSVDGERDRANALSIVAFPARPGPFLIVAPPPGMLLSWFEPVATLSGVIVFNFDRETRGWLDLFDCGSTVCDRDCHHRYWVSWGCCFGHDVFGRGFSSSPHPIRGIQTVPGSFDPNSRRVFPSVVAVAPLDTEWPSLARSRGFSRGSKKTPARW